MKKWRLFGRISTLLVLLGVLSSLGCSSIRSTMLGRNECNTGWCRVQHLRGVPITVKVPTHLKVTVTEKHFLTLNKAGDINQVDYVKLPTPIRNVSHEFVRTEKIFTVDFKRPAAGTMKLTTEFDDEQYFKKIEHEVVDKTIEDVTELVGAVFPKGLFTPAAAVNGDKIRENTLEVDSVVAVEIFEIDDPNFESKVTNFINCHVNQAHDAWVVPPGVDHPRRVPLVDEAIVTDGSLIGNRHGEKLCAEGCAGAYPFSNWSDGAVIGSHLVNDGDQTGQVSSGYFAK